MTNFEREGLADDFFGTVETTQSNLRIGAEGTQIARQFDFVAALDFLLDPAIDRNPAAPGFFELGVTGAATANAGGKAHFAAFTRDKIGRNTVAHGKFQCALTVAQFVGIEHAFTFLTDIEKRPVGANL